MGKSKHTNTLHYSLSTLMKNLVILASFAAAACAMNVAIDKREASMAINSRFRRGSGLGSNIDKECVKKQCKFEEYLESQENQDKAMNRNVQKILGFRGLSSLTLSPRNPLSPQNGPL